MSNLKHCGGCNQEKPRSEFNKTKDKKDGLATQCRDCCKERSRKWYQENKERSRLKSLRWYKENKDRSRDNYLKYKYGINLEEYNELFKQQNGVCALCKKPEWAKDRHNGTVRKLAVDHCHESGKIRGLLCYRCNHILGCIGDNVEGALKIVRYMEGGDAHVC